MVADNNGFYRYNGFNNWRTPVSPEEYSELQINQLVANVIQGRQDFFKGFMSDHRDIDGECGYPQSTIAIDPNFYRNLYDRESVATRVVQILPDHMWQVQPKISDTQDLSQKTPFTEAWKNLSKTLRGESWFKSEQGKGNLVFEYCKRVDRLSRIGRYGVLLLGLDDNRPLNTPVEGFEESLPGVTTELFAGAVGTDRQYMGVTFTPPNSQQSSVYGAAGFYPGWAGQSAATGMLKTPLYRGASRPIQGKQKRNLLFMRAFDESLVQIVQYEANIRNPRFGQPVMYRITFNDPREQHSGIGLPLATLMVHWSRVIHVADNLGSSDIFGVPAMQPCLNRILDLYKLYGGSAEMYWRGAFPGLAFETLPAMGGDVEIRRDEVDEAVWRYHQTLQRYLLGEAMTIKTLSPTYTSPADQIDAALTAIAMYIDIPKRILMGSERGELSSGQDDTTWNDRLRTRQDTYGTPRIVVPLVDRLIAVGVLPEPKEEGFTCEWPSMDEPTKKERADLVAKYTTAMAAYVTSGCDVLMAPEDYLIRILGLTQEEATEIMEAVEEHLSDVHPDLDEGDIVAGREPQELMRQQQEQQSQQFDKQQKTAVAVAKAGGMPQPGGAPGQPPQQGGKQQPGKPTQSTKPPALPKPAQPPKPTGNVLALATSSDLGSFSPSWNG